MTICQFCMQAAVSVKSCSSCDTPLRQPISTALNAGTGSLILQALHCPVTAPNRPPHTLPRGSEYLAAAGVIVLTDSLIKALCHDEIWCGITASPLLTSALDKGEWPDSRPGRFTTRERTSSASWIGSWLSLRAGFDAVKKRKILALQVIEPRPSGP